MEKIMKIFKMNIGEGAIFNNRICWTVLLIALIGILSTPDSYANEEQPGAVETEQTIQTYCPVLTGNKINPDIYTDYKGKRVYLCCNFCKTKFEKNPQKYLSQLPQFASALESDPNHALHEHGGGLPILPRLIVPMGITTLSLVAVTVILSIFKRLNVRLMMKWHKRTGIAALISGAIHAILVLIVH